MSSFRVSKPTSYAIATGAPTPLPTGGNDTQVLTNVNGIVNWTYPQYNSNADNNFRGFTFSYLNSSYTVPLNGWLGCVLHPNGKIYTSPRNELSTVVIDTNTDTWTIQPISLLSQAGMNNTDNTKYPSYFGGVCAENGKIYYFRTSAFTGVSTTSVLVNDVPNNRFYFITINFGSLTGSYSGCCLGPNGKIYGIPRYADNVLVINPVDDSYYFITSPDVTLVDRKWFGGVLAPNGNIYGIPARSSNVLVINTSNDTMTASIPDLSGIGVNLTSGEGKYWGGVLAPNGRIYCAPNNAGTDLSSGRYVLEIDPSSNKFSYVGIDHGISGRKYSGGTLGLDGNIYFPSDYNSNSPSTAVDIFNPNTYVMTNIPLSIAGYNRLQASCLGPNGKIYFSLGTSTSGSVPQSNAIKILRTGYPTQQPWMMAPEYNKL